MTLNLLMQLAALRISTGIISCAKLMLWPSKRATLAGPYDARADLLAAVHGELMSGGGGALGIGSSPKDQLLQFLQPYVAHWQRINQAAQ